MQVATRRGLLALGARVAASSAIVGGGRAVVGRSKALAAGRGRGSAALATASFPVVRSFATVTSFPTKPMEGKKAPSVEIINFPGGVKTIVKTGDFFKGKTVVLFSLPGAFTPTCSTNHLPRYEQLAPVFRAHGVDEIVCVSVNDGFVMDAWGKEQKANVVKLWADGNCTFTEAMGMKTDKSALGFGPRSWRYSMLVKDGTVAKIFAEPVKEGDPFEVSDADTMLKYVAPKANLPPRVLMFSKKGCSFCAKAKKLLQDRGLPFEELVIGEQVSGTALKAATNATSTPQIFMDGKLIGGADALEKHLGATSYKQ